MLSFHLGRFPVLLLWLCFAYLPKAQALKGDSACYERLPSVHFCVNATIENDIVTYHMTNMVESPEHVGWMSLGFGESMLKTPLVILWRNPDGSTTVSQRKTVWYMEPFSEKDPARVATAIQPKPDGWYPEKSTTLAFQISVDKAQLAHSPIERLVWAYSPVHPPSDSPLAHIARHTEVGYLKLDLSKELLTEEPEKPSDQPGSTKPPPTSDDHEARKHGRTVLAHGLLLSFGFLVLLPIGVLTGRWARTFSPLWFKVHWILNWPVAMPMILVGWLLGPIAVNQHDGPHFSDPHKMWGTVLVSIYLIQVLLGRHIHKKRAEQKPPIRVNHPARNVAHVVIGLLILVFAFLQVRSGLDKFIHNPDYANVAHWGQRFWNFWVVAVPFIYIVGLYFLPKQFNQEKASASSEGGYAAISEGQEESASTRLLSETTNGDPDVEGGRRL